MNNLHQLSKTFHGKLLLAGEYTVIDGGSSLALPLTKYSAYLTPDSKSNYKDMWNTILNKEMDAYRFGGDEFLVVLNNGDDLEVEKFLTYLNDNLREINAGQSEIKCSLAMGCSTGEGKDFKEILHMADMKMYENKLMTKMEQHTNNNKS